MAQSNLYKIGQGEVADSVDVSSDSQRELGITTVKALNDSVDIEDRSNRALGNTQVTNTVDNRIVNHDDTVGLEDSTGAKVNPLSSGDQPLDVSGATVPTEPVQGASIETTAGQIASLARGEMRLASTGQISVSSNLNIMLENPGGSGVDLTLIAVVAVNDATSVTFPTLHFNPGSNLPTTARTITDPNLGTAAATAANLYADDMSSEMSGGSPSMTFGTESGRTEIQTFIQLSPGDSVGVSNPFGGITSANATFTAWFIEQQR